jgi:capsular exopolysaccharide synthesis family protein
MRKEENAGELNLEKFYNIITGYKWLIFTIMLISTMLMFINLYFKPSIYSASTMIEVKSKPKSTTTSDILMGTLSLDDGAKVGKEVELFKTFLVNEKAINKVKLQVQYFKEEGYRDIELYENLSIEVSNIQLFDEAIVDKKIILTPKENGFSLDVENGLLSYIKSFFNHDGYIHLDTNKVYSFNEEVKTQYFNLNVKKIGALNGAIKFTILGNNRKIYTDMVRDNLNVQQVGEEIPLIKISYEDTIPKRANDYISALTSSFIEESITNKNEQNDRVLAFIEDQLNSIRDKLKKSENKLELYKSKNDIIEPSVQAKKYIEKLSELEIQLSEILLKEKLVNNIIEFIKNNHNLDAIAPSLMELNDKPTLDLIVSYQALELKMSNLRTELTDKHPELVTVKRQMYYLREKIVSNIKNLKRLIEQKQRSLKEEKRSYEERVKSLPMEEKTLVNINRDYKVSSTMYDYLLKKKTESELLIVSTLSDYKIIDAAHVDEEPIKPKRALLMLVAPLVGLLIGIVFAVILKSLNNKISNKEELEELTTLPLLGIIPLYKNKKAKVEVYKDLNSEFTESYRSLRSNLPTKKDDGRANVILVTSTIENEGKTTLIANLASVFQMAGYRSIILNLDLRKPTLHEYFDLQNDKGMSSYLSGKESIKDIIFSTRHPNLHVIPSGPIPSNPSELILSNRFNILLDILKTRYDYIFIDTPPVGLVSDTIHLMKFADSNIIIFKENHAKSSYVDAIHNIIEKSNIKNVGIVLNQSKSKNKSNGYGYGYGYGYGID